jgi:hypothetical protein
VKAYLGSVADENSESNPVLLPVKLGALGWAALLDEINTAGKYVALDFSTGAVPGSGTEFDPGAANTGEKYIVRLVLPDAAESITAGSSSNTVFQFFTALKEVSGRNIKKIGDNAFAYCIDLTTVSFPKVTFIGDYAFYLTEMTSANFPEAVSIGDVAFAYCIDLTTVSFPKIAYIGLAAFLGCTGLTEVNLPEVISIEYGAFSECTGLTEVNLPASLTSIEKNPFADCGNLTTITVAPGNTHYKAQNGMLLSIDGTQLIGYPSASGTVTLSGISSIGDDAFRGCTGLTSISFPAATSIGDDAFRGCASLTSVSFPEATSIGDWAFYGCTGLTSASFPQAAFIGYVAFGYTGGTALTITLGSTPPTVEYNIFSSETASKTVIVSVPSSAVAAYDTAWQEAFKGAGNTGTTGEVNTNITLTIQGY